MSHCPTILRYFVLEERRHGQFPISVLHSMNNCSFLENALISLLETVLSLLPALIYLELTVALISLHIVSNPMLESASYQSISSTETVHYFSVFICSTVMFSPSDRTFVEAGQRYSAIAFSIFMICHFSLS